MAEGVIVSLKISKNPRDSIAEIKDDATGKLYYYTPKQLEILKFKEGVKVTFKPAGAENGKLMAYNVELKTAREGGASRLNSQAQNMQAQNPQTPKGGFYSQNKGNAPARGQANTQSSSYSGKGGSGKGNAAAEGSYLLPEDTKLIVEKPDFYAENTALKMQKYIKPVIELNGKRKFKHKEDRSFSKAERDLLGVLLKSQQDILKNYGASHALSTTGTLGSRMVVGLGGGSVFETSIVLHHTYGFAYIPGSVIKGCLRGFIIRDIFGGSEAKACGDPAFCKIFGSMENRGKVVFLDAFPVSLSKLELDIMNPHYANYYMGSSFPTDDMSPIPVAFYTVPEGTQFVFRFFSKDFEIKNLIINKETESGAKAYALSGLFNQTLCEMGLGAKTAIGYGWFGRVSENKSERTGS
ncbi:MAG: type III-B CRISPR module RAMP protein Cmr6 [Clostridiales bacterium]|jgi:CRISPR-associated protein Cmr6|nr:type III-B CRISPR module RAMP protein Cmr6 [Clostridiales bacterium]